MEKMDLSKKVLASLLTMSCVYLVRKMLLQWGRRTGIWLMLISLL